MRLEASRVQQLEEVERRLEEMEDNRRNNLILYGLANEPHETHSSLHQKVSVPFTFSCLFSVHDSERILTT